MDETQPDLDAVFDTLTAYQRTAALKAAIELDLFTAIGAGVGTTRELAARVKASERGVRSLCDYLVVVRLLQKSADRYTLSPTAATFLDRSSPACIGSMARFMSSPTVMESFARLTDAVRKGGTALEEDGTVTPDHPVWIEFARSMAPLAALTAELLANVLEVEGAGRLRVLDIAAGHGLFGITIARRNTGADVSAVDWPKVLEVAQENAVAAGVADRFHRIPGSAFTADVGTGYDLVLLTNFLHHFDPPTCETLLRRFHAALRPGGRVAAVEFVPDESRVAPPAPAMFSLTMLATTPSGDAYTETEYARMFANAGFTRTQVRPLVPSPQQVIIAHKA